MKNAISSISTTRLVPNKVVLDRKDRKTLRTRPNFCHVITLELGTSRHHMNKR